MCHLVTDHHPDGSVVNGIICIKVEERRLQDCCRETDFVSLPINSKVEISWIESHLSIEDNEEPIVCFASDVGISAIRPIIREWSGSRPVTLSHLDKGVTVFDKEMTELSTQKENFTYETSTSLSESQEQLAESIKQYGNKATYLLCGRPDDLDKMKKYLEEKGINSPQIKMDRFEGLK